MPVNTLKSDRDKIGLEDLTGDEINPATEETAQSIAGFNIPANDYIAATYPDPVTEVYTYKVGGSSGTIVGVITVVYSNATKAILLSVTKS